MQFPQLDTAVSVQYSAAKERKVRHRAHHFLGDGRQSHVEATSSGLIWRLRYESLNNAEANRLRHFCESLHFGQTFIFIDPWTGDTFANCRLRNSAFALEAGASRTYRAQLEVEDAS
jgi:hypothetical protein